MEHDDLELLTVQSGDTLWSLAGKHLGNPNRWVELWTLNAVVIGEEQRRRKLTPCHPEDWIFPGTVLRMPTRD
jgi:nucleoid-associated protein YgaU